MNTLNFNQSVGFPFETNILDEMQTAYMLYNSLGAIAGDRSIIKGCEVIGVTAGDGAVYINGEILEFKGGIVQDHVIIVETKVALEFEDTNSRDVIFRRHATFGTATTQYPWTDFKRGFETKNIPDVLSLKEDKTTVEALIDRVIALEARPTSNVPIGMIAIWERPANEIPAGWVEHIALKGRIPIGFDAADGNFDVVGKETGSKSQTLISSNLPKENIRPISDGSTFDAKVIKTDGSIVGTTPDATAFSIMNPVRTVHFIRYVG
jgi:hypothetical protein